LLILYLAFKGHLVLFHMDGKMWDDLRGGGVVNEISR